MRRIFVLTKTVTNMAKQFNPSNLNFEALKPFLGKVWDDCVHYEQYIGLPDHAGGLIPMPAVTQEQIINVRAAIAHDKVILEALGCECKVVEQDNYIPYIETDASM
jgi:hypothetical protein